jgi:hypothetical protein
LCFFNQRTHPRVRLETLRQHQAIRNQILVHEAIGEIEKAGAAVERECATAACQSSVDHLGLNGKGTTEAVKR